MMTIISGFTPAETARIDLIMALRPAAWPRPTKVWYNSMLDVAGVHLGGRNPEIQIGPTGRGSLDQALSHELGHNDDYDLATFRYGKWSQLFTHERLVYWSYKYPWQDDGIMDDREGIAEILGRWFCWLTWPMWRKDRPTWEAVRTIYRDAAGTNGPGPEWTERTRSFVYNTDDVSWLGDGITMPDLLKQTGWESVTLVPQDGSRAWTLTQAGRISTTFRIVLTRLGLWGALVRRGDTLIREVPKGAL